MLMRLTEVAHGTSVDLFCDHRPLSRSADSYLVETEMRSLARRSGAKLARTPRIYYGNGWNYL